MTIEFKRFNNEYEADFPSEPVYDDTGAVGPTSIERYNNNEDADETIFRRPVEQVRRRTRHLQEQHNLTTEFLHSQMGRFLDMRSSKVTWNGLSHGTVAKRGVFELSGSIYIAHPMYPDTLYELPSAVVGNESAGFFNAEANRLKEEGDSLWVVFGENTDDGAEQEVKARAEGTSSITQAQLRKGPTWVMIKETALDLAASGITVGSDIIRVFPDPIGAPSFYIERTIRNLHKDENDHWFVEVPHDTPLWDQSTADPVPPTTATTKRTRAASGAEYTILDSGGSTTRVAQRGFASFHSNLEWYGAGRVMPLTPYNVALNDYRENEWQFAVPICIVSDGKLFFPLAGAAGLPAGATTASLSGFVRTAQQDTITASHIWAAVQIYQQASDSTHLSLRTTSDAGSTGQGNVDVALDEAHVDGNSSSPVYWSAPARPARLKYLGNSDGKVTPFCEVVEQGMYTAGGAYSTKESEIRLRRMGDGGSYNPTELSTAFNSLKASQLPYIQSTQNAWFYNRNMSFLMETNPIKAITGHGLAVGANIELGASGVYETRKGKHDLLVSGIIGLRGMRPALVNGSVGALNQTQHSQQLRFQAMIRMSPGVGNTDPLVASVDMVDPDPFIHSIIRDAGDISTPDGSVLHGVQQQVIEYMTGNALTPDGGDENRSYPASPTAGSTKVIGMLFATDHGEFTGGPTYTLTKKHSEIQVRLVLVPTYDSGGGGRQLVQFYIQFDYHNENGDANEDDFLSLNMYNDAFDGSYLPVLQTHLNIAHFPRWAS